MAKVNSLLTERLKIATEKFTKMTSLAEMTSSGNLSSFSGVFRVTPLSAKEQEEIRSILTEFREKEEIEEDFHSLISLTCEVKAINNQAAILHGERIKKAQAILKNYRDGAFSAWLITIYGNRQTPYNFLQYYDLFCALPQLLHVKLDEMPRQAVYTLASRNGPLEKKEEIIRNYQGEPKQELLTLIRDTFPLSKEDKRRADLASLTISTLSRLEATLKSSDFIPTPKQKKIIVELLKSIRSLTESQTLS